MEQVTRALHACHSRWRRWLHRRDPVWLAVERWYERTGRPRVAMGADEARELRRAWESR